MIPRPTVRHALAELAEAITSCRKCPRLITHCRAVARERRRAYLEWEYWGRPVAGFGDADARVLVVGLAPGAHGANRTGRMFTGDGAGQTLVSSLHRTGFASRADSMSRDDGLIFDDLYLTAAVRCAPPDNKPTPAEFARCLRYLETELTLLPRVQVVVALGQLAHEAVLRAARQTGITVPYPKPRFAHGASARLSWDGRDLLLLDAYHPSRQNTHTGRLTPAMLDEVFHRARQSLKRKRRATSA